MSMHREKVLAHAGTRLTRMQGLSDPAELLRNFRRFLKFENERLRIGHRSGANGFGLRRLAAFVLDIVVDQPSVSATWPGGGGEFLGRAKNTAL